MLQASEKAAQLGIRKPLPEPRASLRGQRASGPGNSPAPPPEHKEVGFEALIRSHQDQRLSRYVCVNGELGLSGLDALCCTRAVSTRWAHSLGAKLRLGIGALQHVAAIVMA